MALLAYLLSSHQGLQVSAASDLKNVCFAVVTYLIVMYIFMFRQMFSKQVNVAVEKSNDTVIIKVFQNINRTFENALEQAPMFLSLLGAYSVLVNPGRGAIIGFLYILLLCLYPFVHGEGLN